jgi:hypothetical protein
MITRREWLQALMGAGAAWMLHRPPALAPDSRLITRAIPRTGERLPIVGLGSSATFSQVARSEDLTALRAVIEKMVGLGGTVFDTAPAYGASEEVAGRIAQELGVAQRLFWATKLNVAGWGGGSADPAAARRQLETSFSRSGKPVIDLIQVHNMGDVRTQLPILRELKEKGRVRYIGVTTTFEGHYDALVQTMRKEPLDFIGTDYAVDERHAEQTILPVAQDQGIAEPDQPGLHVRTSQRPLADRHHLHPHEARLALPGCDSGRVLESLGGLGDEPNPGHEAGDGRVEHGDRSSGSTGNAALRPGVNVRHRKLPGNRQPLWHQAEHEPQR